MSGKLSGRRILVTGAASGMGAGIARLFAAEGAALALLDRNGEGVAQVARDLGQPGWTCDVADRAGVGAVVAQAGDRLGGLDGLVNAAGIANTDLAEEVSLESWKRVLDVNLTGTFVVCRACLPHLRAAGGGTIVNLSSGQGLQPFVRRSAYAASKAGVIAFSKSIAMEWAPAIRVNTICPGAIDTPMVRSGYSEEVLRTQVGPRYALGRSYH